MESQIKIRAKEQELNRLYGGTWSGVPGYFTMTGFDYNNDSPVFNANFGYPVKIFANTATGELKTFWAKLFEG